MVFDPGLDIDAGSGADIRGWPRVLQSIEDIFTTTFAERIMREWYGSFVPRFLGENMTVETIVPFFAAICAAIEQWEPCYRVRRVIPESVGRNGRFQVTLEGEYRPRALLGDFTPEGVRRVRLAGNDNGAIEVSEAAA